jgi:hypothetical protein
MHCSGNCFKLKNIALPQQGSLTLHLCKALAAIHRTIVLRFEGNFRLSAASCANGREHLSGLLGRIFSGITAYFATLGLVHEASLSVEFLLTGSEHEFGSALFAD